MKLLIIDSRVTKASDAYSETEGMGGIASSLIYLSDTLAAEGHEVALAIGSDRDVRRSGVRIIDCSKVTAADLAGVDAVIVSNNADNVTAVKRFLPSVPVFLWVHIQHDVWFHDLKCLAHYLDTDHARSADGIVFVSEWQKRVFLERFKDTVPAERCHVIRNACNPFILRQRDDEAGLFEARRAALEVAYVSAPTRGLDTLLTLWPAVRAECPAATLAVYSGQSIYGIAPANDPIHRRLSSMTLEGVDYRGPLSHARLTERLMNTAIVAYPTAFEETSGIAPIEALAAGCSLVCTDRGALPESTAGFATTIPYGEGGHPFEKAFTEALVAKIRQWSDGDGADLEASLRHQRQAICANYRWENRALEWKSLIALYRTGR
ncbi:glycosyltransferase family 4 protein [Azospirillum sp. B506]|uniref:glycosyltransferase family 4 protein n=1 Tax=Azospirillum sp. B506 TaxID=137721 RepID=UPI00034A497B|nr:glycosyltransferase family 4 protein [Azospirillum sp. B506]